MNKRILVADDDELIRNMIAFLLVSEGFDVESVEDGDEAFRALASGHFDVAVLDNMMPGRTGSSVAEAIAKIKRQPTIVITGGSSPQASDAIDAILLKPFEIDDLIRAVRRISSGV